MKIRVMSDLTKDEEVWIPHYKTRNITSKFTKRYHNSLDLILECNKCELLLINYLAELANEDNIVFNNGTYREKFRSIIAGLTKGKLDYKEQTIKDAFMGLTKLGLLISSPEKGTHWVNPIHFFKGDEKDRHRIIKDIEEKLIKDKRSYDRSRYFED